MRPTSIAGGGGGGGEGRLDTAEELYTNKRAPKGVCWKFRYYAQVETTIEVWMDEADGGGKIVSCPFSSPSPSSGGYIIPCVLSSFLSSSFAFAYLLLSYIVLVSYIDLLRFLPPGFPLPLLCGPVMFSSEDYWAP